VSESESQIEREESERVKMATKLVWGAVVVLLLVVGASAGASANSQHEELGSRFLCLQEVEENA